MLDYIFFIFFVKNFDFPIRVRIFFLSYKFFIMNIYLEFLVFFLVLVIIFFAFFYYKPKKLSSQKIAQFRQFQRKISSFDSFKEQILDYDKLYHKMLMAYWYHGTFWDILKQKPRIILNLNKIWELHKLRNKLAHDFDHIDEKILQQKSKEYFDEISILIKKIS